MKNLIHLLRKNRPAMSLATIFCLAGTGVANSADYSWNNSGSSSWFTPGNWSPGGPPTGTDIVVNPTLFGGAVIFGGDAAVGGINLTNLTSSWAISNTQASTTRTLTVNGNVSKAGAGNLSFRNNAVGAQLDVAITGTLGLSSGNLFLGDFGAGQDIHAFNVSGLTTISSGLMLTRGSNTSVAFAGGLSISSGAVVSAAGMGAATTGTTGFTAASLSGAGQLKANNGNAFSGTVIVNGASGSSTFSGQLTDGSGGTGTLAIVKSGGGTQIFSGTTNNYTGGTTVNAGTLLVNNSGGSGLGSGAVTVNGGTLGGSGNFTGALTVNSGGTISPGNSIESLGTGSNIWNGGGALTLEFSTDGSTGTAGSQWDLLTITGGLDLSGASSGNPFVLNLVTMSDAVTPGLLSTWDPNANHTWAGFVTTTTGLTGFSADKFSFNTSAFQNSLNGSFSLSQNGNNLDLVYTIPEPGTWGLLAAGMTAMMIFRRRRRVE